MTTREEIEAVAKRRLHYFAQGSLTYPGGFIQRESDAYVLADAFLAERAERQRLIEAAADEIYKMQFVFEEPRDIAATITRHLDGESNA